MDAAVRDELLAIAIEEEQLGSDAQRLVEATPVLRERLDEQSRSSPRAVFSLLTAEFEPSETPAEIRRLIDVGDRHVSRLQQIVDQHGWPGRTLVGEDAADSAWLVALHADRHPDFQAAMVALVRRAVERREADPRHLAWLEDRTRLSQGRPQLYGTGWVEAEGKVSWPGGLQDPDTLNERRAAIGLTPFDQDRAERANGATLLPYKLARNSPGNQWPTATADT